MSTTSLVRLGVSGVVMLLGACAEPPNLDPDLDQVPNINEALTQSKDANWDLYEWPTVDDYIVNGSSTEAPLLPNNGLGGGCAVGLAEQGEIIYLGVYGEARPGQAWDYGTVAPVGSIAKSFTALAAMTLMKLNDSNGEPYLMLSNRVDDVLSTSNSDLSDLRVDDMLAHRSGAGGDLVTEAFAPNWLPLLPTPDCPFTGAATDCPEISQALAEPRIAFNAYEWAEVVEDVTVTNGQYSNVGYSVLGAMIDEITSGETSLGPDQRGYEKFVWDRLANWGDELDGRRMLTPALTHSWRVADGDFLRYARGYPLDAWDDLSSLDPGLGFIAAIEGWEGPSGGWAMSIGDLTRFATLFANDDFVPADVRDAMVQPLSQPLGNPSRWYGYGVFGNEAPGQNGPNPQKRWYHGGDIGSHAAYWAHWPILGGGPFSAAIICNNGGTSLGNLEPAVNWLLVNALRNANDRPVLKLTIGQLPSAAQMRRASYQIDFSTARFTSPRNLFLPLGAIEPMTLRLGKTNRRGMVRMDMQLARDGRKSAVLNAVPDRKNRHLRSRSTDIVLSAPDARILLTDTRMRFGFSVDHRNLVGLSMKGTLDTRDLADWKLVEHWRDACQTARKLGGKCRSCDDGIRACMDVEISDIRADRRH